MVATRREPYARARAPPGSSWCAWRTHTLRDVLSAPVQCLDGRVGDRGGPGRQVGRTVLYEISDLMAELENADAEVVERTASGERLTPVRLAMLGLAVIRKGRSPLWHGYPPGVFISYKWADQALTQLVGDLAEHLRQLGYRPFLDRENVDADADAAVLRSRIRRVPSGLLVLPPSAHPPLRRSDDRAKGERRPGSSTNTSKRSAW